MASQNRQEQLKTVAENLRSGVRDKLADIRWFLMLRGALALALGIFAIFWPDKNLKLLLLGVGIYCLADGAVGLISALRQPAFRENLLQALVLLAIGATLVWWPGATLRTLLVLLGAAILFMGIGQVMVARRLPAEDEDRAAAMNMGIAAIVIGAILALWPGSGVAVISWVIGIAAILIGALLIFLGSRFKKLGSRVEKVGNQM